MRSSIRLAISLAAFVLAADLAYNQDGPPRAKSDLPPNALARLGSACFRHDSVIVFSAFAPDGKSVLSVGADGIACVWEFPSGRQLRVLSSGADASSATLSPDGKHLTVFCDDGWLRVWDIAAGKQTGKVRHTPLTPPAKKTTFASKAASPVVAAPPAYSPDGNTLMLATRMLEFIDLRSGTQIKPAEALTEPLRAVAFTPDGASVIARGATKALNWDPATGRVVETVVQPNTLPVAGNPVVLSPDGRLGLVVAAFPKPADAKAARTRDAIFFDPTTGKVLGKIELEVEPTPIFRNPIVFSADGKSVAVAAGTDKSEVRIHEAPSGKRLRVLDASTGSTPPDKGKAAPGLKGAFGKGKAGAESLTSQRLLFSPDGTRIAFQPGPRAAVVVLDLATGKKVGLLPPPLGTTSALTAFSPDGRCLAMELTSDATIAVVEVATGQVRRIYGDSRPVTKVDFLEGLSAAAASKSVAAFAFSPDSKTVAVSGRGGAVHVFHALSGHAVASFRGHAGAVSALAFSPSGKTLVSASGDTTAILWDMTKPAKAPPAALLQPGDIKDWWDLLLLDEDVGEAANAMAELVAAPRETMAWIKERVKPLPPPDAKRIDELLRQLGSEQFKEREAASAELLKLGELALPAIEKALAGEHALEVHKRLEDLREKMPGPMPQGERLRAYRAIEVLEHIGSPEARRILQSLADGAPGALITTSAQAALKR